MHIYNYKYLHLLVAQYISIQLSYAKHRMTLTQHQQSTNQTFRVNKYTICKVKWHMSHDSTTTTTTTTHANLHSKTIDLQL